MTVSHWTGEPGLDTLLADYHLTTETEKGTPVTEVANLPARYQAEVLTPTTTFATDTVFVACLDQATPLADHTASVPHLHPDVPLVGCVVVTAPTDGDLELKRLWVAESARGRGVAKALLHAALAHAETTGASVRLSVWRWRTAAITLYTDHGFTEVPPWDERPDLLCLRRGA